MDSEEKIIQEWEEKVFYRGDSFLKRLIIDQVCWEKNFISEELEFYTWLIYALGLTN
ncbi:hypothetical protein IBX65_07270, partial [Candidatus Aerophobetes bacterium]|nr:hypothetical protein [Candidatus Aerophobetes bacterium]